MKPSNIPSELRVFFALILLFSSAALLCAQLQLFEYLPVERTNCVVATDTNQNMEGLGAVLLRNNLAVALSSRLQARLQLPDVQSDHGYNLGHMSDRCEGSVDAACTITERREIIPMCRAGELACKRSELDKLAKRFKRCKVIAVHNEATRSLRMAGMNEWAIMRLLHVQRVDLGRPFHLIHHRQGDVAGTFGGSVLAERFLIWVVKYLCQGDDLPIVVLTEGSPTFPKCKDRIFLASDLNHSVAAGLVRAAKTLAMGPSSYIETLAEVANVEVLYTQAMDGSRACWVRAALHCSINLDGVKFCVTHGKKCEQLVHLKHGVKNEYGAKYGTLGKGRLLDGIGKIDSVLNLTEGLPKVSYKPQPVDMHVWGKPSQLQ